MILYMSVCAVNFAVRARPIRSLTHKLRSLQALDLHVLVCSTHIDVQIIPWGQRSQQLYSAPEASVIDSKFFKISVTVRRDSILSDI